MDRQELKNLLETPRLHTTPSDLVPTTVEFAWFSKVQGIWQHGWCRRFSKATFKPGVHMHMNAAPVVDATNRRNLPCH